MLAHWQFLTRNHLPLVSFSVQLSDSDHLTPGGHYHPSKKPIFRAKLFGLPDAAPCPHSGRPIALNSESVLKGNSPSRSPPPPHPHPWLCIALFLSQRVLVRHGAAPTVPRLKLLSPGDVTSTHSISLEGRLSEANNMVDVFLDFVERKPFCSLAPPNQYFVFLFSKQFP